MFSLDMKTGFVHGIVSPNYERLKEYARKMRREPTDAEKILWHVLSEDRLGVRFRRQHVIGDCIVDFACLAKSLVIEVDGDYHHTEQQEREDAIRTEWLEQQGFQVVRFTNNEVLNNIDYVIKEIRRYI